jgi:hypothetical protein
VIRDPTVVRDLAPGRQSPSDGGTGSSRAGRRSEKLADVSTLFLRSRLTMQVRVRICHESLGRGSHPLPCQTACGLTHDESREAVTMLAVGRLTGGIIAIWGLIILASEP